MKYVKKTSHKINFHKKYPSKKIKKELDLYWDLIGINIPGYCNTAKFLHTRFYTLQKKVNINVFVLAADYQHRITTAYINDKAQILPYFTSFESTISVITFIIAIKYIYDEKFLKIYEYIYNFIVHETTHYPQKNCNWKFTDDVRSVEEFLQLEKTILKILDFKLHPRDFYVYYFMNV